MKANITDRQFNKLENIVKSLCEIMLVYSKDNQNAFMKRLIDTLQEEYDNYFDEG